MKRRIHQGIITILVPKEIPAVEFTKDYYTMRLEDVARKYGITVRTIARIAKDLGLSKRKQGREK